jgi:predicted dehydrogenase
MAPAADSTDAKSAEGMHLLVVGCGSVGRRHLGNLAKLGAKKLSAVDARADRLAEASDLVPELQRFSSLDLALGSGDLDGVLICTPPHLHIAMAQQVAERGLNQLLEKPLAQNLNGVDDLITALKSRGVWAMVGYSMRFHPGVLEVRKVVDSGVLGRVLGVRAEVGQYLPDWHPHEDYRDWYMSHEEQGGGALLDLSHEIDYLRWLLGDVDEVSAAVTHVSDLDIDTDDLSELILRFETGVIGNVHVDLVQRQYRRHCSILGTEGTALWDYATGAVELRMADSALDKTLSYEDARNDQFVDQLSHYLACLRGVAKPLVDVADAAKTLDVVLAAKRSSAERRWVKLSRR